MGAVAIQDGTPSGAPPQSWAVQANKNYLDIGVKQTSGGKSTYQLFRYSADLTVWIPEPGAVLTLDSGADLLKTQAMTWPAVSSAYYALGRASGTGIASGSLTAIDGPGGAGASGGGGSTGLSGEFSGTAGAAIAVFDPVFLDPGPVKLLKLSSSVEAYVETFVGLAKTAAAGNGDPVKVYAGEQVITGMSGLTVGSQLFAYGGSLVTWGSIPSGGWFRRVGFPLSTTSLYYRPGSSAEQKQ